MVCPEGVLLGAEEALLGLPTVVERDHLPHPERVWRKVGQVVLIADRLLGDALPPALAALAVLVEANSDQEYHPGQNGRKVGRIVVGQRATSPRSQSQSRLPLLSVPPALQSAVSGKLSASLRAVKGV